MLVGLALKTAGLTRWKGRMRRIGLDVRVDFTFGRCHCVCLYRTTEYKTVCTRVFNRYGILPGVVFDAKNLQDGQRLQDINIKNLKCSLEDSRRLSTNTE